MPANRSDAARRAESIPHTRRAPAVGIPAQNRRIVPTPDGVSKVGRSATRRIPHRIDSAPADWVTVPRGFPVGDPGYRAMPGRPEADLIDDVGPAHAAHDQGWDAVQDQGWVNPAGDSRTGDPTQGKKRAAARHLPQGRVLQRVGTGRAPFRSAVLGGALLFAVLGAGVAAWAMTPADPAPNEVVVNQVDQSSISQSGQPAVGGSGTGAANPTAAADGTGQSQNPAGAAASATSVPAAPPDATAVITNPAAPPAADLGPATVSEISPGDPGFGWPSTAFGLPPQAPVQPN